MPTVDIYSKQQVDALIAGAGRLPDPAAASAGDVLTLDSNKDPAWVAPSGGGNAHINIITDTSATGPSHRLNVNVSTIYTWLKSTLGIQTGDVIGLMLITSSYRLVFNGSVIDYDGYMRVFGVGTFYSGTSLTGMATKVTISENDLISVSYETGVDSRTSQNLTATSKVTAYVYAFNVTNV